MTAHTADLKESLFEEIKGRLKEDDESTYLYNGYWYFLLKWKRMNLSYYYRRKDGSETVELLFNVNEMAIGMSSINYQASMCP
jgi:oligopeptidase B